MGKHSKVGGGGWYWRAGKIEDRQIFSIKNGRDSGTLMKIVTNTRNQDSLYDEKHMVTLPFM